MDVEAENVMKLLFPKGIPDNLRDNPEISLYISKLGSFGVEQLVKEPDRLNEEKVSLLEQTKELACNNYKTFIQTAECSREIFKQFNGVEKHLDSLTAKLPKFTQKCQEFGQASSNINVHRRLNSLTLTRNAQLLEILELPQLMDTCIRNGQYEEALELAAYVRRLGKKHGQIPIIAGIASEIESAWIVMLHQLLAQLRTDLQLPKCLTVVGYLRRMGIFSEAELRLKFLQARDSWLRTLLASIPTDDSGYHLSKTIELSRIHLFNIVTQYRAIFSDEDPILTTSKDQNINETAIFYSWISEKVSQFLKTLEHDLNNGVGNSLDSVIGQCMYFGLSFGRVGADFRGLLAPIFARTISETFEKSVRKATKKFEQDMENFSLSKVQTNIRNSSSILGPSKQDHPPESLLEFYPLAEYCNGILTSLNDLRLCAPITMANNCTKFLQDSLSSIVRTTLSFYKQEQGGLSSSEKDILSRFCLCLADDLVPHIQKCLHAIYPPAIIAAHIGVNVNKIQEEGVTFLNVLKILEPINHLLPAKVGAVQLLNNVGTINSEKTKQVNGLGQEVLQSSLQEEQEIVDTQEAITQHTETVAESSTDSVSVLNTDESIMNIEPAEANKSDSKLVESVPIEENFQKPELLQAIYSGNASLENPGTATSCDVDVLVTSVDDSKKTCTENVAETQTLLN